MASDLNVSAKPHYRWPWFVLAAFILGVVLAILWLSAEVRRMKRQRDFTYPASTNPYPASTNQLNK